jgi:hypothetical protein
MDAQEISVRIIVPDALAGDVSGEIVRCDGRITNVWQNDEASTMLSAIIPACNFNKIKLWLVDFSDGKGRVLGDWP